MPRLLVATRNAHKTAEIRAILGSAWEIEDLTAYPETVSPEETGATFAANARIKALSASAVFDGLVLADDSGLEVDALDGAPGVLSARYAGSKASDAENRRKLLSALRGASDRGAHFRCVIAIARDGVVLGEFAGQIDGKIAEMERGSGGFGYDRLFIPEGRTETFSELPPGVKNEMSHRGLALSKVRSWLERNG